MGNWARPGALLPEKFESKLARAWTFEPRERRGAEDARQTGSTAMGKSAEARIAFYARITPAGDKLRRRLQRQLGNVSNSDLTERALQALAEDVASEKRPEVAA
jgi:hypothetical protein